ncbi:hypothetical protein BRAS3843_720013 [Bradyrhizobium sp. STM 3843]|uniref:hypothetical protein n=1 Tax=Bradyrhizobium sp. STM 3843 TaxID=551947 RepID=UPI0002403D91|nr:hypothetical protein [Bradyrhizobium sp. STM 3843]CCE11553.1 hypothetical protein BRAS3843_720013 [Bradyrhizobium sp. STM 3843]
MLPPFTTTYAKLEATLVRLHGIPADQVPAFRARFGSLQRGGLLGDDRPGKGKKLEYTPDHFHRAIMAFELLQAGLSPGVILQLINEHWDRLSAIFMKAERSNEKHPEEDTASDVVLVLSLDLIDDTIRAIDSTTRDKVGQMIMGELDSRMLLINLSRRLRPFHEYLAALHLQPDELFEMAERARKKTGKTAK